MRLLAASGARKDIVSVVKAASSLQGIGVPGSHGSNDQVVLNSR